MASISSKTIIVTLIFTEFVTFSCGQIWVRTSSGARPPPYMFSGDSVDKYGHTLYVCKAWKYNRYSAGKTWKANGRLATCKTHWAEREISFTTFSVLTEPPEANYRLEWGATRCIWRDPPTNGVKTCPRRYVGRNGPSSDRRIGTASYVHVAFFYTVDGVEHWRKCGFQILLKHRRDIDRYEVFNVEYDFSKASLTFAPGNISFGSRTSTNNSPYTSEPLVTWSKTVTETSHWSHTEGIEIYSNIEMSFNAEIPTVGGFGVNLGLGSSRTFTGTQGRSHAVSETILHSEKVTLPPHSAATIYLSARKAYIRVPYTSSVRVIFADGTSVYRHGVKGVYNGTDFYHFDTYIIKEPLRN